MTRKSRVIWVAVYFYTLCLMRHIILDLVIWEFFFLGRGLKLMLVSGLIWSRMNEIE